MAGRRGRRAYSPSRWPSAHTRTSNRAHPELRIHGRPGRKLRQRHADTCAPRRSVPVTERDPIAGPACCPIAESELVTPSVRWIVGGVQIYLLGVSSVPPRRRRRSSGAGLTRTDHRARRVASRQSGRADQPVMAPARARWLVFMRAALGRRVVLGRLGVACAFWLAGVRLAVGWV